MSSRWFYWQNILNLSIISKKLVYVFRTISLDSRLTYVLLKYFLEIPNDFKIKQSIRINLFFSYDLRLDKHKYIDSKRIEENLEEKQKKKKKTTYR